MGQGLLSLSTDGLGLTLVRSLQPAEFHEGSTGFDMLSACIPLQNLKIQATIRPVLLRQGEPGMPQYFDISDTLNDKERHFFLNIEPFLSIDQNVIWICSA